MLNTTVGYAVQILETFNRVAAISGVQYTTMVDGFNPDNQVTKFENFAIMGVDGMMAVNVSDEIMVKMADISAPNGIYFAQLFRSIAKEEIRDYVWESPTYVGNCHENEEKTAYEIGKALGEMGYKYVAITDGPHGDYTAESRYKGLIKGLEEYGIEVLAEQWDITTGEAAANATQNFIAAYPELEVVLPMYAVETILGVRTAIINAGKQGEIKIAAQDFTGTMENDLDLFRTGDAVVMAGGHVIDPMLVYIMVANALMGTPLSDQPEEVILSHILLKSIEDAEFYFNVMEEGGQLRAYNDDEIKNMLKTFNPDFTIDDLKAMAAAWSIEDFKARRGLE